MPKHLLTASAFLFAIAVILACASAPAPTPSPQPANAPGGLTFISPIKTPAPGTPATPGATTTPGPMQPPVVIDLSFSTPVIVNQPVTLTISIRTNDEILAPLLAVGVENESGAHLQTYTMTLPTLAPHTSQQVSQTILIPGDEGRYGIVVFLTNRKGGANYHQGLYFAVTRNNVVLNPTPGPASAATVVLIGGTTTALPTRTPQTPVTTVPQATPTFGAAAPSSKALARSQTEISGARQVQPVAQPQHLATITGRLRIPGRPHLVDTTDPIPSRYTKVSVYNLNDLSTAPGDTIGGNPPDELLGETVTDANGYWYLYDVPLVDVDGTRPDVYVIYRTTNNESGDTARTVRSESNEIYDFPLKSVNATWWDYPFPYDPPDSPVIDDLLGSGTTNVSALWLFDDANRAHDYVMQNAYHEPKEIHIYWTFGRDSGFACGSVSCFGPISESPNDFGAFIQHSLRGMPDVVIHEIGHAYRYNLTGLWASSCPGGQHGNWSLTNPRCAWEEGWADFLPTVVNNDPCYDDNSFFGPCAPSLPDANLESPTWGDGRNTGSSVEERVAGLLLDMHDSAGSPPGDSDEGWDNADGYGFWRTWSILDPATEGSQELTLADFWLHWNAYNNFATASPILGPLYQNTIVTHVFLPLQLNGYP